MDCLINEAHPLLIELSKLPRTTIVWQSMPPLPDNNQMAGERGKRNSHLCNALNYLMKIMVESLGMNFIPVGMFAMPWSENLGAMRSHLMLIQNNWIVVLPPGQVATHLMAYYACEDVT